MAAKQKSVYVCSSCGYESPRWNGRCPECGEWNTFTEEVQTAPSSGGGRNAPSAAYAPELLRMEPIHQVSTTDEVRYTTEIPELDRVLGGGIVKGSLLLLGGDPGIGKSTLLLQICQHLCPDLTILYVSGEESKRQIKLRADRLGVTNPNLYLKTETDIDAICTTVEQNRPDLVMIDSIQTMNCPGLSSSPGSVSQVRECTNRLLRCAKSQEIPILIVGHVNKDGAIAGPKVLEHIVDAVLHFEGERNMSYRILRAIKNRYGSTNEIGVFEMGDHGLIQVENPSLTLLMERPSGVSGVTVACAMEGTRPILAEIQALVTRSALSSPRRMTTGVNANMASLLIAVLEKRLGAPCSHLDVYVNVVGGLRIDEPAVGLSLVLALLSGVRDVPVDEHIVAIGEVGLAGEVRSVSQVEARIAESAKLGFTRCIIPRQNISSLSSPEKYGIQLIGIRSIWELIDILEPGKAGK